MKVERALDLIIKGGPGSGRKPGSGLSEEQKRAMEYLEKLQEKRNKEAKAEAERKRAIQWRRRSQTIDSEGESIVEQREREEREREESRLKHADAQEKKEEKKMGVDALSLPVLSAEGKKRRAVGFHKIQSVPMGEEDSIRNIPNLAYRGHVSKALNWLIGIGVRGITHGQSRKEK